NPYLTGTRILLASQLESQGDPSATETMLLEGARRDRQSAPAWALANFYFRAGRADAFWEWARATAAIAPGSLHPLFTLCFALTGDASLVAQRVVAHRKCAEREFLEYLVERNRIPDAYSAAAGILPAADPEDRDLLLQYVDRAMDAGRTEEAGAVWNGLCSAKIARCDPSAEGELVNGDFRLPILNHGFDWRTSEAGCALAAQTNVEGPAMEFFLSGTRPETCGIYHQFVRLHPRRSYILRFQYRTRDLPDPTGLHWATGDGTDYEFHSSVNWSDGECRWMAAERLGKLALVYRRPAGSIRHEGTIMLRRVHLEEAPATR